MKYYTAIGAEGVHALRDVGGVLSRNGWVERVVEVMKKLIATNVRFLPLTEGDRRSGPTCLCIWRAIGMQVSYPVLFHM